MKSHTRRNAHLFRNLVLSAGLAAGVSTAACASNSDSQPETDAANTESASGAQSPEAQHLAKMAERLDEMVLLVVDHADLTAAQDKAVRGIAADLLADAEAHAAEHQRLRASAAAIVRDGTTDTDRFDQTLREATAVAEARMDTAADALVELHTLLEPDQRAAVADALEAHIAAKRAERDGRRSGFSRVASHLMLSTLQIDKLKALREQLGEEPQRVRPNRGELTALIDAFKTPEFSATLARFRAEKRELMQQRLTRATQHADTALSILSEGQREILADLVERGPRAVLLEQPQDG